jgi:hypothetical protein
MGKYIDTCDSTIKMSNVSINPRTKSCHHEALDLMNLVLVCKALRENFLVILEAPHIQE